jgi:hypothetical protein
MQLHVVAVAKIPCCKTKVPYAGHVATVMIIKHSRSTGRGTARCVKLARVTNLTVRVRRANQA